MAGSGDQRAETPPLLDHNGNPITANFEANEFKLTDAPVTYDVPSLSVLNVFSFATTRSRREMRA